MRTHKSSSHGTVSVVPVGFLHAQSLRAPNTGLHVFTDKPYGTKYKHTWKLLTVYMDCLVAIGQVFFSKTCEVLSYKTLQLTLSLKNFLI